MPLPTNPGTVGTPDYQRGFVSPQTKLADVASGGGTETIGLPATTETLVIMFHSAHPYVVTSVVGVTSGTEYPVFPYGAIAAGGDAGVWISPVAPSEDAQVVITVTGAGAPAWTVYADMGIRVVADATLASLIGYAGAPTPGIGLMLAGSDGTDARVLETDVNGRLVPLVPTASAPFSAAGTILAAPSSGANYLFGVDMFSGAEGGWEIEIGGAIIAIVFVASVGVDHCNLAGYRTTSAVTAVVINAAAQAVLRYAPGP